MIALLTTDIGRGHPYYLDGVRQALQHLGHAEAIARSASVFELASGVSRLAWEAVRAAYVAAGRGGRVAELYARTRRAAVPAQRSPLYTVLGAQLRPWAARSKLVLVDHPVLVGALAGHPCVWYQHGEHAAPPESVAPGAARTFVPTAATAEAFVRAGYPRERLSVTGLCIEPELAQKAEAQFEQRRARLRSSEPLVVACFSSGAEPTAHVAALCAAARGLAAAGHRALVFAKRGGRLERAVGPSRPPGLEVVGFSSRAELDRVTVGRFAAFDLFVAPPHERTHWPLGLGLPMALVGPDIGPFPPLNRAVLRAAGVALELGGVAEAAALGERLRALRASGELVALAERGRGPSVDGFAHVARALLDAPK
jgi:hypothetical protein